jgi:hypothetical protein
MRAAHTAIFSTLILLGVAWGGCLVVMGLFALAAEPTPGSPLMWLGVSGIAAGNFVFMEVVADRVIRPARRRALDASEAGAACCFVLALAAAGALWFREAAL